MSQNLTMEQEMNQAAFEMSTKPIRDQLAILRATRGQREVGSLIVPKELQQPEIVKLHSVSGDSRACGVCGKGLEKGEIKICNRCASDPSSDIGVEHRAGLAAVLPVK